MLSLDRLSIGDGRPGEITRTVQKAYFEVVEGRTGAHPEWRTAVYGNQ